MPFEQEIRARIAQTKEPKERNLLKLILGQMQQKMQGCTDEEAHSIVKGLIKGNLENIEHVSRKFVLENEFLTSLLPSYLPADKIRQELANVDVISAQSDGQAMGVAMRHFKSLGLPVEGDTVKAVVVDLRKRD